MDNVARNEPDEHPASGMRVPGRQGKAARRRPPLHGLALLSGLVRAPPQRAKRRES